MAIINFIVAVPDNTPEETIYITGNHDELNNWDPAGIPLAPSEDNTHSVEIELPGGTELEFKFTRGRKSASMEADEDFEEIENGVLTVEDDEEISCTVENWANLVNPEEGDSDRKFQSTQRFYSSSLGDSRTIMVYLPLITIMKKKHTLFFIFMTDRMSLTLPLLSEVRNGKWMKLRNVLLMKAE